MIHIKMGNLSTKYFCKVYGVEISTPVTADIFKLIVTKYLTKTEIATLRLTSVGLCILLPIEFVRAHFIPCVVSIEARYSDYRCDQVIDLLNLMKSSAKVTAYLRNHWDYQRDLENRDRVRMNRTFEETPRGWMPRDNVTFDEFCVYAEPILGYKPVLDTDVIPKSLTDMLRHTIGRSCECVGDISNAKMYRPYDAKRICIYSSKFLNRILQGKMNLREIDDTSVGDRTLLRTYARYLRLISKHSTTILTSRNDVVYFLKILSVGFNWYKIVSVQSRYKDNLLDHYVCWDFPEFAHYRITLVYL